ncbi:MAG: PQQ-binding-like beta-propeller repeat protein [Planctomycetota bacterium]|jgi:outer membrane protein assembly factor BamB
MQRFSLPLLIALLGSVSVALAASPTDWPQWRGVARDGLSRDKGLLAEWPADGPQVAWKVDTIGDGYSSIVVADGRIITMGNVDGEGRVICLNEKDGSTLWSVHPPTEKKLYKHGKGDGGRGTPTIDGEFVYAIGGGGDVTCLQVADGKVVWSKHLVDDLGGKVPGWGYSESPLIDGDNVIVTPGEAGGTVAALNKRTGEVVWQSTDLTDKAHYCSAALATIHGVRQIITFTGGRGSKRNPGDPPRVVGLEADTGKLLWSYEKSANRTANVSTPIIHGDTVFSASAYGTGGGLCRIRKSDSGFEAEPVYFENKMQNHHGGMVLVDGYLYGTGSNTLICLDIKSGEIAWQDRSAGKGSVAYADGHIYLYGEKNQVALVEANPDEYVEKGRFDVPKSEWPTWAHPVVANGKFYLRDMNSLTCYDVSAK